MLVKVCGANSSCNSYVTSSSDDYLRIVFGKTESVAESYDFFFILNKIGFC